MFELVTTFLAEHRTLLAWLGVLSVLAFLGGLLLIPVLVVRLPADFFVRHRPEPTSWGGRHPGFRLVLRVLKNVVAVLLVLAGIALLVLPGQGILTIVMGLGLLEFPGKRRLVCWFVCRPRMAKLLDGIRTRAGRPPFVLPTVDETGGLSSPAGREAADSAEGARR